MHRDGVQESEERVWDVEEVKEMNVRGGHRALPGSHLDIHAVVRQRNRPEENVWIWVDSRIEVVNLSAKIDEVKLTSIEVYSYESERRLVNLTVLADIDPLHETNVGVVEQRLGAAVRICPSACALYLGDPDETIEICDARGFLTLAEKKEVEKLTVNGGPTGDRIGPSVLAHGERRAGTQDGCAQNGTEGSRSATDKSAPRDHRAMRVPVAR